MTGAMYRLLVPALQIVANERRKGAFVEIDGFRRVHSMALRTHRGRASLQDAILCLPFAVRQAAVAQNERADLERGGR
jgi:hypothetical protein